MSRKGNRGLQKQFDKIKDTQAELIETVASARATGEITMQGFKNLVRDTLTEQTRGLTPREFNKRAMETDGAIEVIWKKLDEDEVLH